MARDTRTQTAQLTYPTQDGENPSGSAATPIYVNVDMSNVGGDLNVTGDLDVTGGGTIGGDLGVTGSVIFDDTLNVGADLDVTGNADIGGSANVTGNAVVTGDVAAAGGFKMPVGPFYVTTAADQTAVGLKLGDTVGQTWVAPFPGSVLGASGMIDTAVTGAGKSIKLRVYKNGSLLNAALDLDFTQAGGEVKDYSTAAKDAYAFAAGDALKFVYTTDTITDTPKVTAFLMVEC